MQILFSLIADCRFQDIDSITIAISIDLRFDYSEAAHPILKSTSDILQPHNL
jgi:hypothetical protein